MGPAGLEDLAIPPRAAVPPQGKDNKRKPRVTEPIDSHAGSREREAARRAGSDKGSTRWESGALADPGPDALKDTLPDKSGTPAPVSTPGLEDMAATLTALTKQISDMQERSLSRRKAEAAPKKRSRSKDRKDGRRSRETSRKGKSRRTSKSAPRKTDADERPPNRSARRADLRRHGKRSSRERSKRRSRSPSEDRRGDKKRPAAPTSAGAAVPEGLAGGNLRSSEIAKALRAQIERADILRLDMLDEAKQKRRSKKSSKRHRRKSHRRDHSDSRSPSRSRSASSDSSSGSELAALGRDDHLFRMAAKKQPGCILAVAISDSREVLGQVNASGDVSSTGPIFRRWYESYMVPRVGSKLQKRNADELRLLTFALDELMAGRICEVGDLLASRLRMLNVGTETGRWKVAKQFLSYRVKEGSMTQNQMMDVAVKLADKEMKREKALLRVSGGASR